MAAVRKTKPNVRKMKSNVRKTKSAKLAAQIGNAAREARKRAGLTQEEVAERVGVAVEVYGRMERGIALPSTPTLFKLCRILGVRANALLGLATDENEAPPQPAQPPPELVMTQDSRRLLRVLRKMDADQLAAFKRMSGVLSEFKRKRQGSQPKAEEAPT